ncbi:S24 family peptidase [Vibrio sp. AND4]|uniref:LexA family protein n=1 Tax=Vibrio sp. AND4 TaxID=314289 RepID=UPI00015F310A|nr:S24 family peptidase [Vibrio sp. AND4]EDP60822.1 putative phage repressor [Vibrio sp. AND4]
MKTSESIRRENARALAKAIGGNAAFSDKIDRSTTQVSRFMGKRPTTEIGPKMARHIEQCFEKPEGWLDVDREKTPSSDISSVSYTTRTKQVPILSEVQAGTWGSVDTRAALDDDIEWQITSSNISDDAFAMRVTGNSMTNPHGSPSIPAGSIVVVEPCNCPDNGKIVVATLNDAPQATIKKLEIDGPQKFLVPLNPKYDPIPINGNCRIVGYVKQIIMDL